MRRTIIPIRPIFIAETGIGRYHLAMLTTGIATITTTTGTIISITGMMITSTPVGWME